MRVNSSDGSGKVRCKEFRIRIEDRMRGVVNVRGSEG